MTSNPHRRAERLRVSSKGIGRISSHRAECCAISWRFGDIQRPPMPGGTRPHCERASDGCRCEKQSGSDFAKFSVQTNRRYAEQCSFNVFHGCFPFGFRFVVFVLATHSRKFGTKFPKTFQTTEFFEPRITRIVANLLTMESVGLDQFV